MCRPQSWKGEFLSSRRDTQKNDAQHNNLDPAVGEGERDDIVQQSINLPTNRRTSTVAKMYRRIVNPSKRQEISEGSAYFNPDKVLSSLQPIGHHEYVGEFK